MIYRTLEELEKNTLYLHDTVYFYINGRQLKYSVHSDYLANELNCENREIFSILGINKEDFCRWHYGYTPYGGNWPISKVADFAALTRVVKALYLEIKRKKEKEKLTYFNNAYLMQNLKCTLNPTDSTKSVMTSEIPEKKENTSSNILVKRKSKVKKIIGEEPIKLNNY